MSDKDISKDKDIDDTGLIRRAWVRPQLLKLGSSRHVKAGKDTAKQEKTYMGVLKGKQTS